MNSLKSNSNLNVPEFLTSDYFQDILRKYNKDKNLKVSSNKVGPCGGVGDAFASTMYRVEIFATQKNDEIMKHVNVIVKMLPALQLARDKLGEGSYNVHEKEMEIFQKVLPEFRKILKSAGEIKSVFPRAIAVDRLNGVLVLEDLSLKRFKMADRKVGLDLQHMKLALESLARFHAPSIILLDKYPKIFDKFDIGMFSRKTSAFHNFFCGNMNALTAEVSTWKDFEVYAQKLETLKENVLENSYNVFDNEPGEMKVLAHGDFWLNNVMFQYRNGLPRDAVIVKPSTE